MLEILKHPGFAREAIILYKRGLISSSLGAKILAHALVNSKMFGHVQVIPYSSFTRGIQEPIYIPENHAGVIDLFLVGIEDWNERLSLMVLSPSVISLTIFPIAISEANCFFKKLVQPNITNTMKNATVEVVFDQMEPSLPNTIVKWVKHYNMDLYINSNMFIDSYSKLVKGRNNPHTYKEDDCGLADVYFRHCVQVTAKHPSEDYVELMLSFNSQLDGFIELMSKGFDDWVSCGNNQIENTKDKLKANFLMATISSNGVVMAPNAKTDVFTLCFLLRKQYPQSKALILYHQIKDCNYIYRVQRGAIVIHNPFEILANVRPDGIAQAITNSDISPGKVLKIADSKLVEMMTNRR